MVIDALISIRRPSSVERLSALQPFAAPDALVVETLHVLRRFERTSRVRSSIIGSAIVNLGRLDLALFSAATLRQRVWELRHNFTVTDGCFVALAERLDEPLVTKDRRLASATRAHTSVAVIEL